MPNLPKPKLSIIGCTGLPARYGGFETLANFLVQHLGRKFDIRVYCSTKYYFQKKRPTHYKKARLHYIPLNANGYQSILYDMISMIHALLYSNVLLLLGVSGALLIPFIKAFSSKPIIVNIDGLEWKRDKWNGFVKRYLKISESIAVRFADTVIADNKAIQDYVRNEYGKEAVLIEYGADHALRLKKYESFVERYPFVKGDYAFTVCRIEPENNIHIILEAFAQTPQNRLVIIGIWNHNQYGKMLREKYSVYSNITILDPIYEQVRLDIIRSNCSLYVHGHSAGGTNPSLVEAMYLARPVLAFNVSYNFETTEGKAAYFRNVNELVDVINTMDQNQRRKVSKDMYEIAYRRYRWEEISSKYRSAIIRLLPQAALETGKVSVPFNTPAYTTQIQKSYSA
ncbi:MAG TPA: DUF1972 domain-containing protein [Bacteroidia bacterium]|nr:DUF1972 domain-containing protein [Bacteroidia bacterium]HNT79350.1 DUF1972 domain-containing protein [Bacteroidia bacterium]